MKVFFGFFKLSGNPFNPVVFEEKVVADGGTFEAETCLVENINTYLKPPVVTQADRTTLPSRIYCMGDSITNFGFYETQLNTLLGNDWVVANYGISGNTTTQMLARFQQEIVNPNCVDYVIIMGGVNDLAASANATSIQANLQAMYDMAHNAGIKVIAMTVTPWKGSASWTSTKQIQHDALNAWILANPTNVDFVINAYEQLVDPVVAYTLLPAYNSGDSIHPNQTGLNVLGTYIYNQITFIENTANGLFDSILFFTANAYKASKAYSLIPSDSSGDPAYFRNSKAMRLNSLNKWDEVDNNVPQLQYPSCPSWNIEEGRTNSFANPQWAGGSPLPTSWSWAVNTGTATVIASTISDLVSARTLTTSGTRQVLFQPITLVAGTAYCISVFVENVISGSLTVGALVSANAAGTTTYMKDGATVGVSTLVEANSRYTAIFTPSSSGSANVFVGAGCTGASTVSLTISLPTFETGTYPTSPILTSPRVESYYEDQVPLLHGSSAITFFAIAKGVGLGGNLDRVISLGSTRNPSGEFVGFTIDNSGFWSCSTFGLGATGIISSSTLTSAGFAKLAIVINASKISFFINGTKVNELARVFTGIGLVDQFFAYPLLSRGGSFQLKTVMALKYELTDAQAIALTT
jgi:lysophospholipase L1-like esterase